MALGSRSEHDIGGMIGAVDRAIGAVAELSVKLPDIEEQMLAIVGDLEESEMIDTENGPASQESGGVSITGGKW